MSKTDFLQGFLQDCKKKDRLRQLNSYSSVSASRIIQNDSSYLNFASNDYLGLSQVNTQSAKNNSSGATSSRLVCGNLQLNDRLEEKTSSWKKSENSLLFNSGYQANLGIIPAIADRHTLIFSDKLNHASIIDGIKLSGAKHIRFTHNDTSHLKSLLEKYKTESCRKIIISESLFSMDGDYCDIKALVNLSKKFNTLLYIDDAHGSGLSGQDGIGPCGDFIKDIDIYMATFGKAHGSFGAYCCCSSIMKDFLINKARTLIYSTALPPSILETNINSITQVIEATTRRQTLFRNTQTFRNFLTESNFITLDSTSPIVPIIIGSDNAALSLSQHLKDNGIIAVAIRPPTVPENSARIRFTISSQHTEDDINALIKSLKVWLKNAI